LYEQIHDRIKDEEGFISSLGNATEFSINLTDFDDETLFELKNAMDENWDVLWHIGRRPAAPALARRVNAEEHRLEGLRSGE